MNYRKVANGKKAILNMAKAAKDAVVDASNKVQDYLTDGAEEAKYAVSEIKDTVTSAVKGKLAEEFRKNYPAYCIDEVDKILVEAGSAGVNDIVISMFSSNDPSEYSVAEILEKVADGMVDEDVVRQYTAGKMLTGLFDYIVAYYEAQEQLKTTVMRNTLYINLMLETEDTDDEEVDSEDEAEQETAETTKTTEE